MQHEVLNLFWCPCSSIHPQPRDGEPMVTVLTEGPIRVREGHFSRPRGSSDLLRAPSHFPVPQSRVVLREVSVVWHLYGGRDFGGKAMSTHTQHGNRCPYTRIQTNAQNYN